MLEKHLKLFGNILTLRPSDRNNFRTTIFFSGNDQKSEEIEIKQVIQSVIVVTDTKIQLKN